MRVFRGIYVIRLLLVVSFFTPLLLLAEERVEVSADSFEADELKRVSHFRGSVYIKKGSDEIKSQTLIISFGEDNRPTKYEAVGSVSFKISTKEQRFEGRSKKIIYEPIKKRYIASGDVYIVETTKDRILTGESIVIDRESGRSKISGAKDKPVKFIFTVDE